MLSIENNKLFNDLINPSKKLSLYYSAFEYLIMKHHAHMFLRRHSQQIAPRFVYCELEAEVDCIKLEIYASSKLAA